MTTPTRDEAVLLPCPFCGSEAEIERYGDRRQSTIYRCTSCSCSLETGEEWSHGRDWNERSSAGGVDAVAWRDVLAERCRQIEAEGWAPAHDDQHAEGEMADAAALYASLRVRHITGFATWPWAANWWKPKDRRSDLVRAGALILAEIERLDRKEAV